MRILVLIHELPPIGGGGGQAAQDLCRGLAARGHEVLVLTAHLAGLPEHEIREGFEVIRLRSGRKQPFRAGLGAMAGYMLAAVWNGLRLAHVWRPDVIHVHFAVPNAPAALVISRLSGIPYVLTAHLGDVPGGTPEKTARWFRWVLPFTPPLWKSASAVIAVSEFTRQLALKQYPVDIQVIHNGIDVSAHDPGEIRIGQPPQIVFAGRFVQQKNPLQVVRVLGCLRDLPWHCAMLGDGPLREEVQAEISRLDLDDRFTLTGWIEPEKVIDWFHHSDILFMPSLSEGLPVAGLQALACGLAVIAGRVGGFIDLVKDGHNGFLLDPRDSVGFQAALSMLLGDPAQLLYFRQSSREHARQFDLNVVVESYIHLFESIR
jgi:L-malate glycosyltransferase